MGMAVMAIPNLYISYGGMGLVLLLYQVEGMAMGLAGKGNSNLHLYQL